MLETNERKRKRPILPTTGVRKSDPPDNVEVISKRLELKLKRAKYPISQCRRSLRRKTGGRTKLERKAISHSDKDRRVEKEKEREMHERRKSDGEATNDTYDARSSNLARG